MVLERFTISDSQQRPPVLCLRKRASAARLEKAKGPSRFVWRYGGIARAKHPDYRHSWDWEDVHLSADCCECLVLSADVVLVYSVAAGSIIEAGYSSRIFPFLPPKVGNGLGCCLGLVSYLGRSMGQVLLTTDKNSAVWQLQLEHHRVSRFSHQKWDSAAVL